MHFRGLDLNLLVALDALITERSISRTGEKIHLSQPATSGALARLREYFKDDLLVPVGRKMVLTPLAEELAEPVRQLLLQTDAIIHRNPGILARNVGPGVPAGDVGLRGDHVNEPRASGDRAPSSADQGAGAGSGNTHGLGGTRRGRPDGHAPAVPLRESSFGAAL